MLWIQGYVIYLMVGGVFGVFLSALSYKYRKIPGRRYFWIFSSLVVLFILTTLFELISMSFTVKLVWRNIQQIPLFFMGLSLYGFVLDYIGNPMENMKRQIQLFSIPLLMYVLLIFTDPYHHLMRISIGLNTVGRLSEISVHPTLLSILFIAYNQIFTLYAILILVMNLQNTPKHYYKQHFLLLLGFLTPVILLLLLPLLPFRTLGITAVIFLPSGIIIYYALFRNQFFTIWLIAKDKIFINMKDGVVLTDRYDLIVDVNPAAARLLSSLSRDAPRVWIGQHMNPYLKGNADLLVAYVNKIETTLEFTLYGEVEISYSATFIPIGAKNSLDTAMLIIFSDISDKRRYERDLIQQATIDELTGIYNRRYFLSKVKEQLENASSGVVFMLMDLDNFKLINDTYGHVAGDQVLTQFSNMLKKYYSGQGIAGRVGGEEFAVFLNGISKSEGLAEAERFRKLVEAQSFTLQNGCVIPVTVSIGVVITQQLGVAFEELYQQADVALYASKRTGKNKVTRGK